MDITIPYNTLAAIELFASPSDVRDYLRYTHVTLRDANTAYLTAADGGMLARTVVRTGPDEPMGAPGESAMLPMLAASLRAGNPYYARIVTRERMGEAEPGKPPECVGYEVIASRGPASISVTVQVPAARFPDIARVWPKTLSLKAAAYDAALTARLAKAKKLLGIKRHALVLPNGDDMPGLCELGDTFAVIVMPVRVKAPAAPQVTLCDWHGTKLAYPDPEPANEAAS